MRGKGWTRIWIGIALLLGLVVSHGVEALAQDGAAPSSQEPITLELSVNNWGDAVIQAIEEGVKRFEALNPGIKVEVRRRGTWDRSEERRVGKKRESRRWLWK